MLAWKSGKGITIGMYMRNTQVNKGKKFIIKIFLPIWMVRIIWKFTSSDVLHLCM